MGVREEHAEVYDEFSPEEVEHLHRHGTVAAADDLDERPDEGASEGWYVATADGVGYGKPRTSREEAERVLERVQAVPYDQALSLAQERST